MINIPGAFERLCWIVELGLQAALIGSGLSLPETTYATIAKKSHNCLDLEDTFGTI